MTSKLGGRRVVLVTLSLLIAGGIAYATIPDSSGVIHGCVAASNGTVRVIDSALSSCRSNEQALNWNVTGPQGPQGPEGPGTAGFAAGSGPNPIPITENTEVVSLDLPGGSYLFSGKVVAGDTVVANVVICSLFNDGTAGGPSILDTSQTPNLAAGNFATLPLIGSLTLSGNATVSVVCTAQNDGGNPIGQFGHLNAVQVASLQ
jgi:hypothetical protein